MQRLLRFWRIGGQDLRIIIAALFRTDRPPWLIPAVLGLGLFALEPLNFAIPFPGIVDDFVLLPLLLRGLAALVVNATRASAGKRSLEERVVSSQ